MSANNLICDEPFGLADNGSILIAERTRPRCQGMLQILRFNWPWYVGALAGAAVSLAAIAALELTWWLRLLIVAGVSSAMLWTITSVLVSHWVYDRSPLCRWD